MMHFSWRYFLLLLASVLLVGPSLVACGSDGAATVSATDSMTLKVAQVTKGISFFPLYVAIEENFFKAQGLTLDPPLPPSLGSGAKLSTAVEAGRVELGVGGLTDVFTISRVDAYIKLIGAVSNGFLIDIVASKRFEEQAHVTALSPLADKIHALMGKKVGIASPNGATDALVTYLFRQQHLDAQKEVTKVNLGADIATNLAALQAGRVDATVVIGPAGTLAEVQGIGDTFISPVRGDIPAMQGQLFGVAFAKQGIINSKPKAVQAFIRGIAQAETFIQQKPVQAQALMGKYLKLDQKTLVRAWNATKSSIPQTPQIDQASYETANQFHVEGGLIALPLAYSDLVDTDTIDNALSG
jgi:sulfonate transport system substrate-binding protein